MRKTLGMLLILTMALGMLAGTAQAGMPFAADFAEPGPEDITEVEALEIARPIWIKNVGTADNWDEYIEFVTEFLHMEGENGETRHVWALRLYNRMGMESCLVLLDAQTQEVIREEVFLWYELDAAFAAEDNARWFWSLEDKALYYRLYVRTDMEMVYEGLPGPEHVTQERAMATALEALEEYAGMTEEKLAALRLDTTFYVYPIKQHDYEKDSWVFAWRPLLPDKGWNYKILYQVTVNANDGSLVLVMDEHYMLYPPQSDQEPGKG